MFQAGSNPAPAGRVSAPSRIGVSRDIAPKFAGTKEVRPAAAITSPTRGQQRPSEGVQTMCIPLAFPAVPRPSSEIRRIFSGRGSRLRSGGARARGTSLRSDRPDPVPRGIPFRGNAPAESGDAASRLVTGGALLNALALASYASLSCLGLLNLDTMTLLPAAACTGTAAMSLGVVLACWRALRGA